MAGFLDLFKQLGQGAANALTWTANNVAAPALQPLNQLAGEISSDISRNPVYKQRAEAQGRQIAQTANPAISAVAGLPFRYANTVIGSAYHGKKDLDAIFNDMNLAQPQQFGQIPGHALGALGNIGNAAFHVTNPFLSSGLEAAGGGIESGFSGRNPLIGALGSVGTPQTFGQAIGNVTGINQIPIAGQVFPLVADAALMHKFTNPAAAAKSPRDFLKAFREEELPLSARSEPVRDLNRARSEANTAKVVSDTLAGKREQFRLSHPEVLKQVAKRIGLPEDAHPTTPIKVYRAGTGPIKPGEHVTTLVENATDYVKKRPGSSLQELEVPIQDLVRSGGLKTEFIVSPLADKALDPAWFTPKGTAWADQLRQMEGQLDSLAAKANQAKGVVATDTPKSVGQIMAEKPLPWEDGRSSTARLTPADIDSSIKSAKVEQAVSAVRKGTDFETIARDIRQNRGIPPKAKVNILDYLRTPDRVLKKLGMESQATQLKTAELKYQQELPKNMAKIKAWADQTKVPGAEERIFRWLDGNKTEKLQPTEQRIANEIKSWLGEWAERLQLPKYRRVSDYITHIWENGKEGVEFDDEFARLIEDKIPGSVYNPFLDPRLGKKGYVEDVWRALEAYTKRATRKVHMDPALDATQEAAAKLDLQSEKYIKRYADRINLRPTEMDNLVDAAVKSIPGVGYRFGQRPVASISRAIRTAVYRGTLGGNLMSPIKNLTQGINTYAQLGEKYTALGYARMAKGLLAKDDELFRVGVLANDQIDARTISAGKQAIQKMDKVLFALFDLAEKINRGAAYYGAKAKALAKPGVTEEQAIQEALETVRKTQFVFGNVNTPVAMQSDLVKLFTQFQSYNLKQTEFVTEMVKNKEFKKMARFVGATLAVTAATGQFLGMKPQDFFPVVGLLTGENKLGSTPAFEAAKGLGNVVFSGTDEDQRKAGLNQLSNAAVAMVPAGVQAKKTIGGINDFLAGKSTTSNDRTKFDIAQTPANAATSALFGSTRTPEGTAYRAGSDSTPSTDFAPATDMDELKDQISQLKKQRKRIKAKSETGVFGIGATSPQDKQQQLGQLEAQQDDLQRQLDLAQLQDKVASMGSGDGSLLGSFQNQKERQSLATSIYHQALAGDIDSDQAQSLVQQLGFTPQDIERKSIIALPDEQQAQYVNEAVTRGTNPMELILEGVLTNNVAKQMYTQGLIPPEVYTALKGAIKGASSSAAGRSRKAKAVKLSVPKTNLASLVGSTVAPPKIGGSASSTAMPTISAPKVDLDAFRNIKV